jgi:phosphatidylglycerophosphate synthase
METPKSTLGSLGWKDVVKGFIMIVIGFILAGVETAIQQGTITFTWHFFQPLVYTGVASGIAYLLKNFFTNSQDQFATKEPVPGDVVKKVVETIQPEKTP